MIEETLLRIAVALEKLVELRSEPLILNAPVASEDAPVVNHDAHVDAAPGSSALVEPPKKRRGRPTKEEAAAKAAATADAVVADVSAGAGAAIAAALPVEQPKCPDCGAVLTAENSSTSSVSKKLLHVGCKAGEKVDLAQPVVQATKAAAPQQPELKIEKVREAALAFTAAREKAAPGTGRQAFIDVLASMGAKVLADVPQPKWAELVQKLTA